MRIGLIINLAPRKLGSLEQWLVSMAAEARQRGHQLDIFGRLPVHEEIASMLQTWGTKFSTTDALEASPVSAIRTLSSYDVLHVNMFQPRMKPALLAYAAWPAKVILVDHTSGSILTELLATTAKGKVSSALDKVSLARVDGVVGVSEYVRQRDIVRFGINPTRIRTIYNGVDTRLYQPRPRIEGGPVRLAAVAHLTREKGIDVLLKAVSRLQQNVTLDIAGDGPLESEFRSMAHDLRIADRVRFLGLRNDVQHILANADVFIHPARWQEAFGLTITEGMATGCAVVASSVGGIPEIIEHDKSGLLVRPDDDLALASALSQVASSRERRAQLGEGARARVVERFRIEQCAANHVDYIEEIAWDARPISRPVQPMTGATRNVVIGDPSAFDRGPRGEEQLPGVIGDDTEPDAIDDEALN
jgi:glycosyltransferase involved in cell wall biosynthesis